MRSNDMDLPETAPPKAPSPAYRIQAGFNPFDDDGDSLFGGQKSAKSRSSVATKRSKKHVVHSYSPHSQRGGSHSEERSSMFGARRAPSLLAAFKTGTFDISEIKFHNEIHRIIYQYVESHTFKGFLLFVILVNTAILIAFTFHRSEIRGGWYFNLAEFTFLGIYTVEMILKLYVFRLKFFEIGWNDLDCFIVVLNICEFIIPLMAQRITGFHDTQIFHLMRVFRTVRVIRALRVLRTIRFLSNLQVVVTTILQSLRSIGYIVMLISLFMYMFSVIGRGLYSTVDPNRFGSLIAAFFTLFQLLTLDDWFDIYQDIRHKDPAKSHVIIYLMAYIVVEYFVFLNLFVAVLVDNFQLTIEAQNRDLARTALSDAESDDEFGAEDDDKRHSLHPHHSDNVDLSIGDQQRKTIGDHYPGLSERALSDLRQYFLLVAAIEYNYYVFAKQQRVLEMMVSLTAESEDVF